MRGGLAAALCLAALLSCATLSLSPAGMTLDEKIGQLFVYAARGVFMNEESPEYRELVRQVRENHVGGVIWSLSDVYETAFLTRRLQAMARRPLLVAADLEAGIGMRFEETTYWPWPMAVAAAGDPSLAERQGRILAEEARALGINQIYAPVADVNDNPGNPVINVRSYGEDPSEVARYVVAFIRGVQAGGLIATVKHFPGHGDTRTDSHRSLPVLEVARDRLERVELLPFRAAISAGVASVMTAHLSLPLLDATPAPERRSLSRENPYTGEDAEIAERATVPASLSPAITEVLLRRELRFEGLVLTDAADMGALTDHFDPGETAVRAILAGADQIPKSPDIDGAIAAVRHAVEEGRISRERLDASVRRILAAKARAGVPESDAERIFREVDRREHRELAEEIARRSLTLIREAPGSLPLPRSARLLHLVVGDGAGRIGEPLDGELSRRLENPHETRLLDPRSGEAEIEAAVSAASRADTVLVSLFVRFQTGRGSIATPDGARRAVEQILVSGVPVVAVSFGSPYVLGELHGLPTFLAAYGAQKDVQVAAARALFGEAAIGGRLPVTIPGIAPRGSGIVKPAQAPTED